MNRNAQYIETLIYYDGPQLFLAQDQFDTHYLCLLVQNNELFDKFLCVPISLARLYNFYQKEIDLRKVYVSPESDELYLTEISDFSTDTFELTPISSQVTESWLPDAGFYFEKEQDYSETIIEEAQTKNRAILHLSLNPPEARTDYKINTLILAEALITFQSLVKYAYRKTLSELNIATQRALGNVEYYTLDVFSFSLGSFTVHLQSRLQSDLFGYVDVAKAFERIDQITQNLNIPDIALSTMRENKGHLATAYLRLLQLIIDNNSPITYKWIIPEAKEPIQFSISKKSATDLYELFNTVEELGVEIIELIGKFTKIDTSRNSWSLTTLEDAKEHSGSLSSGSKVSFSGAVIDSQLYKLICEERIEEVLGSGREKTRLYLISYEPYDLLKEENESSNND